MKQHIFTKGGVLLASLSVFLSFFACREDLRQTPVLPDDTPAAMSAEIQAAKTWFDNYQKESSLPDSSKFKNMEPVWSKAVSVHNVVEVPFAINGKFHLPSLYQTQKSMGRRKLVIYNNGSRGRVGYVVDFMPSETFTGKIKDINSINFRQAKFSGMIDVYNLNHVNLGGFMYKNGQFIQRYHKAKVGPNEKETDPCTYTTVWVCDFLADPIICYDALEVTCSKPDPPGDPCDVLEPPPHCGFDPCSAPNPPPNCGGDPCSSPNPPAFCGGGDPCNSPNPPPSCGNDPCSGPNPPPDCGGGGDCNGQPCDPCELDPSLPECKKCSCTVQSIFLPLASFQFPHGLPPFINSITTTGLISGIDCKTGTAIAEFIHQPTAQHPCKFEPTNEVFRQTFRSASWSSEIDCGFTCTYYAHLIMTVSIWWSGEPLPLPVNFSKFENVEFVGVVQ